MHICIIPAKLKSNRVQYKNIRMIDGKPIICHVIYKLLQLNIFDEIIISTDSDDIVDLLKKEKVSIFKRVSKEDVPISDVLLEFTKSCQLKGVKIDFISCCFPTSILLEEKYILECCNNVINLNCSSSLLIKRFTHPIERALRMDSGNSVNFINSEYAYIRTQELPTTFYDSGQFYCLNVAKFHNSKAIIMTDTVGVVEDVLDSIDVDTEADWNNLERLYFFKKNQKKE